MAKANYLGVVVGIATFASLLIPWWTIRASGVSIDIYPLGVRPLIVPTYDADWVVDRLLALDGTLLIVGLLLVVSGLLAVAGSLKLPPLLVISAVMNLAAAFLFYKLMRSAIGELALWPSSGTNLIPVGPWGFAMGIHLCTLAGLASLVFLIVKTLRKATGMGITHE